MSNGDTPRPPFSVSELTDEIRQSLEERYQWVQVQGEISNFKKAPSGHVYFNLKDANAVLSCVAWRSTASRWSGLDLKDGCDVLAGGSITLYPPRGQYQLVVDSIRLAGVGALQQAFDALKRRLADEGLFDAERKKPLPEWPQRIAVITSPTGAAVRDFARTLRLSQCPVHATVCPVRVQGLEAAGEIASMIQAVNQSGRFDVIALVRGGGSLEDLWSFNEEIVAKAIAASNVPVISGVGHEIDFTISDFTADFRAATPTAAAQVICDLFDVYRGRLQLARDRILRAASNWLQGERKQLDSMRSAVTMRHPRTLIYQERQRLDDRAERLQQWISSTVTQQQSALNDRRSSLLRVLRHDLMTRRRELETLSGFLRSYDPHKMMERGYSICRREDGSPLTIASGVNLGDKIRIQMSDGSLGAEVNEVEVNE
ncbi:exodeoxyribonuclease VII large subunit [bacterium]|nr:exodeoxyribonuclease VII large subunit [bacterium]